MALNDVGKSKPKISKEQKLMRQHSHLFEETLQSQICRCGLSKSYPIHNLDYGFHSEDTE